MARLTSYDNDIALHDEDLLTGSNYISVGKYNTRNFKLVDLAGYFANFTVQDGGIYNLATISQNVTTNTNNISSNAQYSLNLASSFGTFDANGNLVALSEAFANLVLNVATSEDYATASQLTSLTATVNNNTASITSNASDITTVTASTTQNTTDITTNTGNISTITTTANANATAISTLQTDLQTANTSITQNATNITTLDSSVTTINTTITGVQGDVTSNTTNITANASDITTLQNNLSTANTNISQNATDLTSLTSTVSTNTTNISNNDTDIASNTTNIATNTSGITTLTNNLATTNANVTQNASDVTSLTTTVSNNTTNITANAGNITTNTSDISTNASNISTLTNDLATANTNITQNASDVTSLTSTVSTNTTDITTAEGNITTNTTNISTNASDITTLTNNLNTATTNISQNSSNITTLTSDVSTNSTNIGNNTTSISSNATNITTLNNNLSTTNANVTQNATDLTSLTTTVSGNTGGITANASSISSLTTTVNGNTADITSVSTIANRSDGFIKSSYGLTATAGGVVTGMQIVAANNTTSSISEVKFQADKFIVNSSSTNLTPFSISGSKIQFNGDINAAGTVTIQGTDTTADDFLALRVINAGATNGRVGMKIQNASGYYGKMYLDTSSVNNINNYSLDFFIGPTETRLARMSGGGLSLDTGRIYFNDDFAGNTSGGDEGSIAVEGVTSGTGNTMYVVTPSNQSSSYAFALRNNSSVDYLKAYTSGLLETGKLKITNNHLFENITGGHLGITSDAGKNISFRSGTSQRMIIESGGEVGINQGSPSATLHLTALTSNGVPFKLEGHGSTSVEQMLIYTTQTAGSGWYNMVAQANGTTTVVIRGDGNVYNANNVYAQWSDQNLKENITQATDKLEEVKQLQVKNFNFIGDDTKQIGLIAQEVEEIFPSLVDEAIRPGDESATKTVKYSVLVPILIKAIQELEGRVAALETP